MAPAGFRMTVTMAFLAVLWVQSSAQQPPCTPAIASLSPCIGFITGNSITPSSPCCTQLATVIQTQVQCLCTFISSSAAQLGFKINQTQALTLPGTCKIQTPPLSQCNAVAGAPAATPAGAPAPATSATPSSPSDLAPSTPPTPSQQLPMPSVPSGSSSPTSSTPITGTPSVPTGSSSPTSSTPIAGTPSVPTGSSSPTSPSTPTTDSGAKTVPTTSNQSSAAAGSSTTFLLAFLLLVASTFSSI